MALTFSMVNILYIQVEINLTTILKILKILARGTTFFTN